MSLILTLNESGTPLHWSTWQDAAILKAKGLVAWELGEYDWTKFGGVSRMTGQRSSMKLSSIMAIRGNHHPKHTIPTLSNPNLFRRDRSTCAYCGRTFRSELLTNDHITPRSRGGSHSWNNCITSCKRCNNRKDSHLLEEIGMELLFIPYVPNFNEGLILRNRLILADQLDFIKVQLPSHSRMHKLEVQ
jgi:5-methylcytosine-specific restriction endonuclease McrA